MTLPVVTASQLQAPAPTTPPTTAAPAPAVTPPAATPDAPPPAAPEPEPKKLEGKAFAALTRQEKAFRADQAKWKADRELQEKEWNPKLERVKKFDDLISKAKSDKTVVLAALQEMGVSFEELSQLVLNDNKPTAEMIAMQARAEAEAIRKELADRDKKAVDDRTAAATQAEEAAVKVFKDEIRSEIGKNPDTVLTDEDIDLVYHVIEEHFVETSKTGPGKVLSAAEAIGHVEAARAEEIEEKWFAKPGIQKLIAKRSQPAEPVAPAVTPPAPLTSRPSVSRTLTNSAATGAPTPSSRPNLSREESLREAAKLIKWTS